MCKLNDISIIHSQRGSLKEKLKYKELNENKDTIYHIMQDTAKYF